MIRPKRKLTVSRRYRFWNNIAYGCIFDVKQFSRVFVPAARLAADEQSFFLSLLPGGHSHTAVPDLVSPYGYVVRGWKLPKFKATTWGTFVLMRRVCSWDARKFDLVSPRQSLMTHRSAVDDGWDWCWDFFSFITPIVCSVMEFRRLPAL